MHLHPYRSEAPDPSPREALRLAPPGVGGTGAAVRLRRHPIGDPDRAAVERFVSTLYARRYGARVPSWAPELVSVSLDGEIVAAAGWRPGTGPLYLERYLDEPIERRIARSAGIPAPDRARIVEVGHLGAARPGEGLRLMRRLGVLLAGLGYRWVASTATPGVRVSFERIGVRMFALAPATIEAAGPHAAAWGRYYERGPTVVAGELAPNLARVARRGAR
ncbi:MAG TPA: thermostable hemolysin [Burkholderiaceae bacterium]|nr:thermostable hemolysin [Burkholderiaceae bacterium]